MPLRVNVDTNLHQKLAHMTAQLREAHETMRDFAPDVAKDGVAAVDADAANDGGLSEAQLDEAKARLEVLFGA